MIEVLQSLDWNEVWKELRARRTMAQLSASSWEKRSSKMRRSADSDPFTRTFLSLLQPRPDWTVLDMGCGPGTLTLPLAALVSHVTAADFSQGMLDIVGEECRAGGIANVTTRKLAWEDDWQSAKIGRYDAVIASRSLVCDDLRDAVVKLDRAARHKVFICTIVGDGPFDRRVFNAIGRPLNAGPDYICNYNLLYQMGILARVDFIRQEPRTYKNADEAFESMAWMVDDMTEAESRRLRAFVEEHAIPEGDQWTTDYDRTIHWAVLSWDTDVPRRNSDGEKPYSSHW